ncbi:MULTISPECIES: SRPBCC family protein [Tsukamurella]|uniref:SRPBCC domain-containing protein n=1 Tax=Tsukamurella strandjordii TaxID=147577 RepID=A0AA90SPI7_9ACTN|nr:MULTISPECIES: SRPBCC domain-containing protein [Tsukamurella]MDP0396951.1 SRPBCC domain-containing protein [Tsukamurella strandjordii]GIZ96753.1 activator of HSP90 ATPase [Tsukamurella sp. TY48]
MPVLSTASDREALTFDLVAEFATSPEKVWQLWEDPRLLEKWWGPPTWPATFVRHELTPGGQSRYYMTGPDGTKAGGWFATQSTDAPSTFTFRDGFAGEDGEPVDPEDYSTTTVVITPAGEVTRMNVTATHRSLEQLDRVLEMGMAEGMTEAMNQIDALLAE